LRLKELPVRKVSPFLWFDSQAEEAANFYVSLFPNAKVTRVTRYLEGAPGGKPAGSVMTVEFEIDGVTIVALNGGPHFKFTEAVSLTIDCDSQAEVDRYWKALSEGGEEGPCGWLKDRYGLSWQVNPHRLGELISDPDPKRAKAAMDAMLKQKKIVLAEIEAAADAVTETA
jgi:predicted 3-demethylubiquinone-9 3-methyltransferase (glyoxalase superfamily)